MAKEQDGGLLPSVEGVSEVDNRSLLGVLAGDRTEHDESMPCMQKSGGDKAEGFEKLDGNIQGSSVPKVLGNKLKLPKYRPPNSRKYLKLMRYYFDLKKYVKNDRPDLTFVK